ncbi:MAG: hypothetical protein G01um101416_1211 [Microgenomates group bacterium Gr01-1014_16]|nr:MAG: hypothetical protein G01um101416_1211 [Microgenomates group bacterium Gr01-1014_16]
MVWAEVLAGLARLAEEPVLEANGTTEWLVIVLGCLGLAVFASYVSLKVEKVRRDMRGE